MRAHLEPSAGRLICACALIQSLALCGAGAAAASPALSTPARAAVGIYVLGPTSLVAGTGASYRIVLHWASAPRTSGPLAGALVTLRLRPDRCAGSGEPCSRAPSQVLGRQRSDARGEARLVFTVPAGATGDHSLEVEVRSRVGRGTERQLVSVVPGGDLLLTTDKPLYQPGQVIHVRALALRAIDRRPLAGRGVTFTLRDPRGNRIFERTGRTSRFGVASVDFQLAEQVNLGTYTIAATVTAAGAAAAATRRVAVKQYDLPRFSVQVAADRRAYRPGDRLSGTIRARYTFGQPVRGARVETTVAAEQCSRLSREWRCRKERHSIEGITDRRGEARYDLRLGPCRMLAVCTEGVVRIRAVVTDAAESRATGRAELPLSQLQLKLALTVPGGRLVPGVANTAHLLAGRLDGRPVRGGRVTLNGGAGASARSGRTDSLGTATLTVVPRADRGCAQAVRMYRVRVWARTFARLEATVEDGLGNQRQLIRCLPLAEDTLQVVPRASFVGPGEAINVEIRDPAARDGEPAYLDLIKAGQTLVTLTRPFAGGSASFSHRIAAGAASQGAAGAVTPELGGLIAVRGYRLSAADGERISQTRSIYVAPPANLRVSARLDRGEASYRPGETARLDLQVRDGATGRGVQAAVGLHAVDAALLSLIDRRQQDQPELFFSLAAHAREQADQLGLAPGGRTLVSWLGEAPGHSDGRTTAQAAALRRRAVEVLLSAVQPPSLDRWESDPWGARRDRWEEQSATLTQAAREAVWTLSVGQRTSAGGWRFHPRLVALLIRAGKVPRRYLRDPWQREVRPEALQAEDSALTFAPLARQAAAEKLEKIYDLLEQHTRRLRLPREHVPGRSGEDRPLVIPAEIWVRLLGLPGVTSAALVDPWGQPFRRRSYSGLYIEAYDNASLLSRQELYSPGPDGKVGTLDDVVPPGRRLLAPLDRPETYVAYGVLGARSSRAPSIIVGQAMLRGSARSSGGPVRTPARVRSRFPETLLWKPEVITDGAGRASVSIPLADSITTYKVLASASTTGGLFGRTSLDLSVFQPFFIQVELPRTLTQGDQIGLPVTIHNYLKARQTVTLRLIPAGWFAPAVAAAGEDSLRQVVTLEPSELAVRHFPITVRQIGQHALTVRAAAVGVDGREVGDAVRRSTQVLPDGNEQAVTLAGVLGRGSPRHTLTIPAGAIASTARVGLSIHPGPVSQTLEGLEGLLRMPHGCFEQTSSTLYPNVLILDYLRRARRATPVIEARARRFIDAGYQRLLTFEVPDGGFSWFGDRPANQVLTAYGLLELTDIGRIRPVDRDLLARTRRWLLARQAADGSWGPDANYYLDGAVNHLTRDRLRITAYIARALSHAGERGPALDRATRYVTARLEGERDPYTLALAANLLVRVGPSAPRRRALDSLWAQRRVGPRGIGFSGPGSTLTHGAGASGELETTALAAQAMLRGAYRPQDLPRVLDRLVAGKDRFGAWHSTQATILSLQALLAGQQRGAPPRGRLEVLVDGARRRTVLMDGQDRTRHLDLTEFAGAGSHTIELRGSRVGRGAHYRLVGSYWLPRSAASASRPPAAAGGLAIATSFSRTSLRRGEAVSMSVRVSNRGAQEVPMPLVSLALPPGFELDDRELARLVKQRGEVDRAGRWGGRTVLYLNRLGARAELAFSLRLHGRIPLRAQARPSEVYEYYQPENRAHSSPVALLVR